MVDYIITLTSEEVDICKKFAEDSSKTQREHRSGGKMLRNIGQIYYDTFRGKVGEVIIKKFLEQEPFHVKKINLDFDIYPRGKWDSSDIDINNIKISIKSSKHFARWLLLESKDINRGNVYDYYILVLIENDFKAGTVKGFAKKMEITEENDKTFILEQGDLIPNTQTRLDAKNHARHSKNLHNTVEEWSELAKWLKN
jgi:hypothetical protein